MKMASLHNVTDYLNAMATTVGVYNSTPQAPGMNGTLESFNEEPFIENATVLVPIGYRPSFRDIVMRRLEWKIAGFLSVYGMLVISCIGVIANIVSLRVLCGKRMRVTACAFLLISLAVADELASILNLLNTLNAYHLKSMFTSDVWCKVSSLLNTSAEFASVWILVALTAERFVAVCFPFKLALWHTRKTLVIAVLLIVALALLQAIPTLITVKALSGFNCNFEAKYKRFWGIWYWFVAAFLSYIPIVLLTSLNCALLKSLRKAAAIKTTLSSSSQGDTTSQTKQVTKMCLAVSIVFTICLLPIACHRPVSQFVIDRRNPIHFVINAMFESISWSLLAFNHCVNFFIYCITGKRFREELHRMFCCVTPSERLETSMSNLSTKGATAGASGKLTTSASIESP